MFSFQGNSTEQRTTLQPQQKLLAQLWQENSEIAEPFCGVPLVIPAPRNARWP
jgi:hypothetical protein